MWQRKNVEAIALDQDVPPRTLQRFLESIKWDQARLRNRCQQLIARDHADPEAIGLIDETGTTKAEITPLASSHSTTEPRQGR